VIEFVRRNNLPQELEKRVTAFYRYKGRTHHMLDIEPMTLDMPGTLRNDVKFELMHQLLDAVQFIITDDVQISDSIKYYVASHLHIDLRLPGEEIYQAGDEPAGVYIILSGNVHGFLPKSGTLASRHPAVDVFNHADVFGELETVVRTRRCLSAKAVGFAELGCFRIHDWEHVLVSYTLVFHLLAMHER
jgi:hypothetical protein